MSLDPNNKKAVSPPVAAAPGRTPRPRWIPPALGDWSGPPCSNAFHAIDVLVCPSVPAHEARRTHRAEAVSEKILTHLCLPSRALVVRQKYDRPAIGDATLDRDALRHEVDGTALLIPAADVPLRLTGQRPDKVIRHEHVVAEASDRSMAGAGVCAFRTTRLRAIRIAGAAHRPVAIQRRHLVVETLAPPFVPPALPSPARDVYGPRDNMRNISCRSPVASGAY